MRGNDRRSGSLKRLKLTSVALRRRSYCTALASVPLSADSETSRKVSCWSALYCAGSMPLIREWPSWRRPSFVTDASCVGSVPLRRDSPREMPILTAPISVALRLPRCEGTVPEIWFPNVSRRVRLPPSWPSCVGSEPDNPLCGR